MSTHLAKSKSRRAGRPIDTEKTSAILEAAERLFIANGVEAVSIEQIAAEAGVAKTTVYSKFGSKDAVFQRVISQIAEMAEEKLQLELDVGHGPEQVLAAFGASLLHNVTQDKVVKAEPLITMETQRDPTIGRKFFDLGPGRAMTFLTRTIADLQENGVLDPTGDSAEMAEDLLGLWMGIIPHRMRFCHADRMTPEDAKLRANAGAAKFMRLYGVPEA